MNILAILALLVALGFSLQAAPRFWELARRRHKRACLGLALLTASLAFTAALHLASLLVGLWGMDAHLLIVYRWVLAGSLVGQGWLVLTDLVPSLKKTGLLVIVFIVFAAVVTLAALGLTDWAELVNWVSGLLLNVVLYRNIHRSAPLRRRDWDLGLFPSLLLLAAVLAERFGPFFPSWLSGISWPLVLAGLAFSLQRTASGILNVPSYLKRGKLRRSFKREHSLSRRQFWVIRYRLQGKTLAEAAEKTGLDTRKVRAVYRSTLRRLGLKSRMELRDLVLSGSNTGENLS